MGQDMNILPDASENAQQYAERVILSAAAKWMLTAVHGGFPKASVKSIRSKAFDKLESFLGIVDYQENLDVKVVVDCLYDTLLDNGMFYHEPEYVWPVEHMQVGLGDISLVRGIIPEEEVWFGGVAPYVVVKENCDLANEFMLWPRNGEETIRMAWKYSSPQSSDTRIEEYLRINHQEYRMYYIDHREDQAEITMGRNRMNDAYGYSYYLIRGNEIRRMTDDYINASIHQYVRLAIMNGNNRRKVKASIGTNLVKIEIGYYLPDPDARFLRLVSWPLKLQMMKETNFGAYVHPLIWPVIKERLCFLGYAVEESHE